MKEIKKTKPEIDYSYDDEIDLFELFQKIWKWKWLTITLVIVFCTVTFIYVKTRPVTYTIVSTIKIGKIANVLIEQITEVQAYLQSEIFNKNNTCLSLLDTSTSKHDVNDNIISIKWTVKSPDIALSCLEKATNNLLNRHDIIYKKGLKKFNDNITSMKTKMIIEPTYFLDTYTFPSSLVTKPEIPINPDSKKLSLKIAAAFFSSIFLGIFLSLFIEYILSHRKKD